MNITIRDVDERVFREFKTEAVRDGSTLGNALTRAIELWLKHSNQRKKDKKSLSHLKSFDWGEGTEKVSIEVDETLYGV